MLPTRYALFHSYWPDRARCRFYAAEIARELCYPNIPPKPEATLTPRPASEHNWAKSAIDRAQEVKQQVKRERASNEVP